MVPYRKNIGNRNIAEEGEKKWRFLGRNYVIGLANHSTLYKVVLRVRQTSLGGKARPCSLPAERAVEQRSSHLC